MAGAFSLVAYLMLPVFSLAMNAASDPLAGGEAMVICTSHGGTVQVVPDSPEGDPGKLPPCCAFCPTGGQTALAEPSLSGIASPAVIRGGVWISVENSSIPSPFPRHARSRAPPFLV
jgi:hypothetical protein